MQEPTLVIMAAGMGSRFGGLKQVTPVDEAGHPIIDFSLYDAWRAGFRRVVFIIKRELEAEFRQRVGRRAEEHFQVSYVFQDLDRLPEGFAVPEGREKPWGTGHAVACCRGVVEGPFAVINADDFYGPSAYTAIYDFLRTSADPSRYAMVGYRVRNTVTEHGSVSRGVCEVRDGFLTGVTERTKIYKRGDHAAYTEDGETFVDLPGDTLVSMNLWGSSNPTKCEYYLPAVVNAQLSDGSAAVQVLPCEEAWYGVTYREDLDTVRTAIARMKREGLYPDQLWT